MAQSPSTSTSLTKPTVTTTDADKFGTVGNDYVFGTSAGEVITGGIAAIAYTTTLDTDTLEGGLGDDWYIINSVADTIIEYAGGGIDTVFTNVNYTLPGEVENIVATNTATASTTGFILTGNAKDNILDGSQSKNSTPADVNDTLIGSTGNDTYYISGGDKITDTSGIDTIISKTAVNLTAMTNFTDTLSMNGIENVTLLNGSAANITGNSLNNILTGNSSDNIITGGAGNDTLDTGSAGTADALDGGAGNDIYVLRVAATISDSAGIDTVKSFVDYTASPSIENMTAMGRSKVSLTGNTLNNILTDNVVGASTADATTLRGGLGNDIYMVSNAFTVITEEVGQGTADTVQYGGSDATNTLAVGGNVEKVNLTGTANLQASATGPDSTNTVNVAMTGNSGNNRLTGGSGSDTLIGGAGSNSLVGKAGNDLYIVTSSTDSITESAGEGTDAVQFGATSGTLALTSSNIESITLTGTSPISVTTTSETDVTLTGNSAANTLTGSTSTTGKYTLLGLGGDDSLTGGSNNDTLNGGTGADILKGGAGNDYYVVDSPLDAITDSGTTDLQDTLESSVSANLDITTISLLTSFGVGLLEHLVLTGPALDGGGNAANNKITGNNSNNTLTGLGGDDTLNSGAGNDTITGGVGVDSITSGTGSDTIQMVTVISNGVDKITDFSRGASGDTFKISLAAKDEASTPAVIFSKLVDGSGNAVINTDPISIHVVSGKTTLLAGDNIIELTTKFTSQALMLTAIEVGGSSELTFASNHTANDDVIVLWSDGTNTHVTAVNIAGTADKIVASGTTAADLVVLTGMTALSSGDFVASNFGFIGQPGRVGKAVKL